jgi:hypothetical protein
MFSASLEIFQGAHRAAICTRLSTFHMNRIIKLCRQNREVIQNHENDDHVRSIEQGETTEKV